VFIHRDKIEKPLEFFIGDYSKGATSEFDRFVCLNKKGKILKFPRYKGVINHEH
jgi:hypothetical protein